MRFGRIGSVGNEQVVAIDERGGFRALPAPLAKDFDRAPSMSAIDIITTGTPPGVGMGKKPPLFLKPGDVMSLGISKLGEQRQTVRAYEPA